MLILLYSIAGNVGGCYIFGGIDKIAQMDKHDAILFMEYLKDLTLVVIKL